MSLLMSDAVLNVLAGAISTVMIVIVVNPDYMRFIGLAYAVFFGAMFFLPDGGQVNIAMALGFVAYALLTWVGDDTRLPDAQVLQRERVPVFTGVMTAKANVGRAYNTFDPTSSSYKRLPRSINRMGGAQFTYSVWVMFERGITDADVAGRTLFMRGDVRQFAPTVGDGHRTPYFKDAPGGKDYTIATPRVSFLSANSLAVDVNTDRALRHRFVVGSDDKSVELRKNALSLIPGNFALLTFVLEDNVGIDSFERGIRLRFYLNDELYHTETAAGSLRQNDAPLHLLLDQDPEQRHGIDHCKIADLTYYNFALADAEVAAMFSRGYTNAENKDFDTVYSKDNRLKLSAYNKVDLYNYDAHLT